MSYNCCELVRWPWKDKHAKHHAECLVCGIRAWNHPSSIFLRFYVPPEGRKTAEHIKDWLLEVLNDFRVPLTKIVATMSDNEAKVIAAGRLGGHQGAFVSAPGQNPVRPCKNTRF